MAKFFATAMNVTNNPTIRKILSPSNSTPLAEISPGDSLIISDSGDNLLINSSNDYLDLL